MNLYTIKIGQGEFDVTAHSPRVALNELLKLTDFSIKKGYTTHLDLSISNHGPIEMVHMWIKIPNSALDRGYNITRVSNFVLKGQTIPDGYAAMSKTSMYEHDRMLSLQPDLCDDLKVMNLAELREEKARIFWK